VFSLLQFFDAGSMQPMELACSKNDLAKQGGGAIKSLLQNSGEPRVSKPKELGG
jgi:hypothetical protein